MEGSSTSISHDVARNEDILRFGLQGVKGEIISSHPLQTILETERIKNEEIKETILGNTYGAAFPLRMDFDKQILSRFQRPPGALPSSMLGLEALTGSLDDFGFEDYLNEPRDSETFRPADSHHGMEVRLGLSRGPVYPVNI